MRESPDESVVSWLDAKPAVAVYVTSINQAEILHGVELLPKGKRRDAIAAAARAIFETEFSGRILGFGSEAAEALQPSPPRAAVEAAHFDLRRADRRDCPFKRR